MKRTLLLVILAFIAAGWTTLKLRHREQQRHQPPVLVETAPMEPTNIIYGEPVEYPTIDLRQSPPATDQER